MTDVESLDEDLRNMFFRCKEKQGRILVDALSDIDICCGKHLALIEAARNMFWYRRLKFVCQTFLGVFLIILVLTIIGMWLLRSSYHANIFGGCSINVFVPFDECPIAF